MSELIDKPGEYRTRNGRTVHINGLFSREPELWSGCIQGENSKVWRTDGMWRGLDSPNDWDIVARIDEPEKIEVGDEVQGLGVSSGELRIGKYVGPHPSRSGAVQLVKMGGRGMFFVEAASLRLVRKAFAPTTLTSVTHGGTELKGAVEAKLEPVPAETEGDKLVRFFFPPPKPVPQPWNPPVPTQPEACACCHGTGQVVLSYTCGILRKRCPECFVPSGVAGQHGGRGDETHSDTR
jgi:hypothetical protein